VLVDIHNSKFLNPSSSCLFRVVNSFGIVVNNSDIISMLLEIAVGRLVDDVRVLEIHVERLNAMSEF
jgi:hypothetical protein